MFIERPFCRLLSQVLGVPTLKLLTDWERNGNASEQLHTQWCQNQWFSDLCAPEWPGELIKTQISGPHSQSFWFSMLRLPYSVWPTDIQTKSGFCYQVKWGSERGRQLSHFCHSLGHISSRCCNTLKSVIVIVSCREYIISNKLCFENDLLIQSRSSRFKITFVTLWHAFLRGREKGGYSVRVLGMCTFGSIEWILMITGMY